MESPLVEREAEVERIDDAFARLHLGVGGCILLRGPVGTGKSRLIEAAVASARALDLPHWYGSGGPTWRGEPLLMLRETLGGIEPPDSIPGGRAELLAEIENRVATVPHLLAIDNLHTADPATLSVLAELAEHIQQYPLLLLLSYRPDIMPELPHGFGRATTLDLRRLTPAGAAAYVRNRLGVPAGPALGEALAGAGGDPLRISLWLWDLNQRGALVHRDGTVDLLDPSERPGDLRDLRDVALARRRQMLGRDAFDLMRLAAVIGRRFRLEDLAAMAGQTPEVTAARLQPLLDRDGATNAGHWWLVRWRGMLQNLYGATSPTDRARRHRAYARLLQDRDGSPVEVAEHLLAAARPGDGEAVAAARRGAAAVLDRLPEVAAHLLGRALDLLASDHPDRAQTLAELMEAERAAGNVDRARAIGEQALTQVAPGPARTRLELTLLSTYEVGSGPRLENLASAILSNPALDARLRRPVLAHRALERVAWGRLDEAVADAEAVLADRLPGPDQASAVAVAALAWAADSRGDPEEALRLIHELEAAVSCTGPASGAVSRREGLALYALNRFDEALEVLHRSLREAERAGSGARVHAALLDGIADVHYGQGAWDEALAEWELVIDTPAAGGFPAIERARQMRALVAAYRGDYEPARELRERRLAGVRAGRQARPEEMALEAILLEHEGDPAGASAVARQVWAEHEARDRYGRLPFELPWVIRFGRGAGIPDAELAGLVAPLADRLLDLSRSWKTDSVAGAATLARGVRDRNAAALTQAVHSYQRSPRASDQCLGLEVCGDELVRLGLLEPGVEALLGALDSYRALGARPGAERVLARLRELGVERGLRRPRVRPGVGWESLSEEELTVAALVSSGLSNPKVAAQMSLPRYRVAAAVEGVMAKLGVASRLELSLLVARRARNHVPLSRRTVEDAVAPPE